MAKDTLSKLKKEIDLLVDSVKTEGNYEDLYHRLQYDFNELAKLTGRVIRLAEEKGK